jgi:hypothetical protein
MNGWPLCFHMFAGCGPANSLSAQTAAIFAGPGAGEIAKLGLAGKICSTQN